MTSKVWSPSDLVRANPSAAERVEVGGRVLRDGPRTLLSDAFHRVGIEGVDELVDGELAIVEGAFRDDGLVACRVVFRAPGKAGAEVLRFADRGTAALLARRASANRYIRDHFTSAGFLEVDTPKRVVCPGLDLHLDAFATDDERFLITSPEYQMKRLLVGGLPRVFQLASCFRKGELGSRHNPEFTMLEWYRAFSGMDEIIADTEALVHGLALALADARSPLRAADLTRPWRRFSVTEAFARFARVSEVDMLAWAVGDEERFYRVLLEEIEPAFAAMNAPVVLHRYPANMASLARLCPDDARYSERFEVYLGGIELSNGFGELTDPTEQRRRLVRDREERQRQGKPAYPLDERFLAALEEGMPPSGGNALGVDRLLSLTFGTSGVHDVIAFPESHV